VAPLPNQAESPRSPESPRYRTTAETHGRTPATPRPGVRTYVLDTSVLLADPRAVHRFEEHEVVLPVVVITELEGKRHHPELGFFARTALRTSCA
jgi:PhoH-like ATPase